MIAAGQTIERAYRQHLDLEYFLAASRRRASAPEFRVDCSGCQRIACVCDVVAAHRAGCSYLVAVMCAVPIECEHGFDACPKCDPCDCQKVLQ